MLDEADRLLALGFEHQIRSLMDNIRPDRQVLLFSATFSPRVERLAGALLENPVRIQVGTSGSSNTNVTQRVVVLGDKSQKWDYLVRILPSLAAEGMLIVFVNSKAGAEELAMNLNKYASCGTVLCLQGDMDQTIDRTPWQISKRGGSCIGRDGRDPKGRTFRVKNIVSFDCATSIDGHVHRVEEQLAGRMREQRSRLDDSP